MGDETRARDEICEVGLSLFSRGLTFGSTGNISVRLSRWRLADDADQRLVG